MGFPGYQPQIKDDTLDVEGTFTIPAPGRLEVVLTKSGRNEDPRYLGIPYRGAAMLQGDTLVIEFDQATFTDGNRSIRPNYGYNFVDNTGFSTKVQARIGREPAEAQPQDSSNTAL